MAVYKTPLRAGMNCGLPIVTWSPSSGAQLLATAHVGGALGRMRRGQANLNGEAQVSATGRRLRRVTGRLAARAQAAAQAYRLRRATASVLAIAQVSANGQTWLPLQPERPVRYRRYSREDFQAQLLNLLPMGRAWPRDGEDAALMGAWAEEMYRIEQRGWKLLEQWDPRTTDELFEDWERFFELPGTGTKEQRRQALIAEWLAGGTLSREDIDDILDRLGIRATIEYVQPFCVDISAVGDALNTDWYSTWIVYVHNPDEVDLVWLQAYLRRLAPAGDYVHVVADPRP